MMISIIVPAFNEERYLPSTLAAVNRSVAVLEARHRVSVEIVVVDNASTDGTAAIATSLGARVVFELEHNIARVRNRGAEAARGEVILFVDADTLIEAELLTRVYELMQDQECSGGAAAIRWRLRNRFLHWYFSSAANLAKWLGLAQGASQFCRREVFRAIGGYDESLHMAEDAEFYLRLRKYARRVGGRIELITDLPVLPSTRRYEIWPVWRTLLWTNPLVIVLFCRTRFCWRGWYDELVR